MKLMEMDHKGWPATGHVQLKHESTEFQFVVTYHTTVRTLSTNISETLVTCWECLEPLEHQELQNKHKYILCMNALLHLFWYTISVQAGLILHHLCFSKMSHKLKSCKSITNSPFKQCILWGLGEWQPHPIQCMTIPLLYIQTCRVHTYCIYNIYIYIYSHTHFYIAYLFLGQ